MSLLRLLVNRCGKHMININRHIPSKHLKFSTTSIVLNDQQESISKEFDESLLELIVCPLSKNSLRYDKENSELICDEINVAYPIVNGIPNLVPQDARMLKNDNQISTDKHLKTESH